MPDESTEMIELHMQETRASLTQKVSSLEHQVMETLHSASTTVSNMVEQVKTAVPDTIADVKDSLTGMTDNVAEQVKASLDLSHHVRDNPWAMMGGAAALGFITGLLVFRHAPSGGSHSYQSFATASAPAPSPMRLPGWLDQIVNRLGDRVSEEVRKLGEVAVSTASTSLKQSVEKVVPNLLGSFGASKESTNHAAPGEQRHGYSTDPRVT